MIQVASLEDRSEFGFKSDDNKSFKDNGPAMKNFDLTLLKTIHSHTPKCEIYDDEKDTVYFRYNAISSESGRGEHNKPQKTEESDSGFTDNEL